MPRRSRVLTDHDEIRRWAEERDAQPACVRGTGSEDDIGMIRLDFPGYGGETSLEAIEWDDWFDKFDENNLALIVEDETAGGEQSNFNKIVGRETAEAGAQRRTTSRRAKREAKAESAGSRRSTSARAGARGSRSRSAASRTTGSRSSRSRSGRAAKTRASSRGTRLRSSRAAAGKKKKAQSARGRSRSRSRRGRAA